MNTIKTKYNAEDNTLTITATLSQQVDRLYIDNQDTFVCKNEPSSVAIWIPIEMTPDVEFTVDVDLDDFFYVDFDTDLLILFFRKVENLDYYVAAVCNKQALLNLVLDNISIKTACDCSDPDCADVNYYIAWLGFMLASNTGDYPGMVKYWKILHNGSASTSSNCGCNG